jgi:transposase-like protein
MTKRVTTPEQKAQAIAMRAAGIPLKQIAKQLDMTPGCVDWHWNQHLLRQRPPPVYFDADRYAKETPTI